LHTPSVTDYLPSTSIAFHRLGPLHTEHFPTHHFWTLLHVLPPPPSSHRTPAAPRAAALRAFRAAHARRTALPVHASAAPAPACPRAALPHLPTLAPARCYPICGRTAHATCSLPLPLRRAHSSLAPAGWTYTGHWQGRTDLPPSGLHHTTHTGHACPPTHTHSHTLITHLYHLQFCAPLGTRLTPHTFTTTHHTQPTFGGPHLYSPVLGFHCPQGTSLGFPHHTQGQIHTLPQGLYHPTPCTPLGWLPHLATPHTHLAHTYTHLVTTYLHCL